MRQVECGKDHLLVALGTGAEYKIGSKLDNTFILVIDVG